MMRTSMLGVLCVAVAAIGCKSEKPAGKPADPPAANKPASKPSASAVALGTKGSTGAGDTGSTAAAGDPGAQGPRPTPPTNAPRSADSGFRPDKDGFKFANYGNSEIRGLVNLTPDDMVQLFGPEVCASSEGGCTLSPAGQQWMEEQNKGMDGGHCEGFAAIALLIKDHKVSLADLGADSPQSAKIEGNVKLQRQIATWFVTQATAPTRTAELKGYTPTEIVDFYADSLVSKKEVYSLGFYKRGGGGGHAVTPYAVEDKGGDVQWIKVYDNNYPNEERHVEVNRKTNTWKYEGSTRPDVPKSEYEGDADTRTLTLTPTSPRLAKQECPFCGDVGAGAPAPKGSRQVWMDGEGDLLIEDGAGHKLGMDNGKLVNTIPGSDAVLLKSRDEMHHEPVYLVPEGGSKLEVTLDGTRLTKDSISTVALIAHGYTFAVDGIALHKGQKDRITFSQDSSEVKYRTDTKETPLLELGIQTAGADYLFAFRIAGEAAGQEVDLKIDLAKGTLALFAHGKDPTSRFDVKITRIDPKKAPEVYEHKGTPIAAADTLVFNYKDWKGAHQGMDVGTDKGGDGAVDATAPLGDQH